MVVLVDNYSVIYVRLPRPQDSMVLVSDQTVLGLTCSRPARGGDAEPVCVSGSDEEQRLVN